MVAMPIPTHCTPKMPAHAKGGTAETLLSLYLAFHCYSSQMH